MENQIWKAVSGFEGLYEVSNTGNVRSIRRRIHRSNNKIQDLPGIDLKK